MKLSGSGRTRSALPNFGLGDVWLVGDVLVTADFVVVVIVVVGGFADDAEGWLLLLLLLLLLWL